MTAALPANRVEIGRFVNALFQRADTGFVSLRTFLHQRGAAPFEIRAVEINSEGLEPVVAQATGAANRAARAGQPTVFAPPVAVFRRKTSAAEKDLLNGLAIVAELDDAPQQAKQLLAKILGEPTVVVASGGTWTDPETSEVQDKRHVYWRLAVPTRTADEHGKLKRANRLVSALAGSDPSAVTAAHPLRWPGSVHRKAKPKLCRISELHDELELDLTEAEALLEKAARIRLEHATGAEAARLRTALDIRADRTSEPPPDFDPDASDPDLEALADAIPNNDEPRAEWVAVGLAFYAASEGKAAGLNAWDTWSRKSIKGHGGTVAQWEHFAKSPATRTGIGSLVKRAQSACPDFRLPTWGPERKPQPTAAKPQPNGPADQAGEAAALSGSGRQPASPPPFEPEQDDPQPEAEPTAAQPWPEPLGEDAFYGIAGEIVRKMEPETEADPAALLFQLLTGLGSILGAERYARVEADIHPPRIWTAQVGRTSKGRKGTAWGRIRELLASVAPAWATGCIASGMSSGEGVIYAVRDPVVQEKRDPKFKQVTTEVVDEGAMDKRLLLFEGEFAKALRSMERQGNILSAVLRDAWDHGNLRTLIKNNPTRATGAHVSVNGHITVDELRRCLDQTEMANGLANRILFVCVERSKLLPRGGLPIDWSDITGRLKKILAGAPTGEIHRTDEFWALWVERYPALSADRPGLLGAILGRGEAQVLRLALLYALLDRQEFMDACHLRAALECWRYSEASARFIFGDSFGDPVADEILRVLRLQPAGMTRNELRDHFDRNRASAEIGRALAGLTAGNFVFCTKETTRARGRPAERWFARK